MNLDEKLRNDIKEYLLSHSISDLLELVISVTKEVF